MKTSGRSFGHIAKNPQYDFLKMRWGQKPFGTFPKIVQCSAGFPVPQTPFQIIRFTAHGVVRRLLCDGGGDSGIDKVLKQEIVLLAG